MSDLDLTEATEAVARAITDAGGERIVPSYLYRKRAKAALDAAAPLIEAQLRERIAADIERDGLDPGRYTLSHPFGNTLRVMGLIRDDCARIARGGTP